MILGLRGGSEALIDLLRTAMWCPRSSRHAVPVTTTLPDPLEDDQPRGRDCPRRPRFPTRRPPELRFRRAFRFKSSLAALWQVPRDHLEPDDPGPPVHLQPGGARHRVGAPRARHPDGRVHVPAGRVDGKIDTGGVWYPLFAYVGLLPWTFFSSSVSQGRDEPRRQPAAQQGLRAAARCSRSRDILGAIVNVLVRVDRARRALRHRRHAGPRRRRTGRSRSLVILLIFTTGVTLLIAGLTVYLRDMRHALPLSLQLGLFVTPIVYGAERDPDGVAQPVRRGEPARRRSSTGCGAASSTARRRVASYTIIAAVVSCIWLVGSFMLFKRLETGFADVSLREPSRVEHIWKRFRVDRGRRLLRDHVEPGDQRAAPARADGQPVALGAARHHLRDRARRVGRHRRRERRRASRRCSRSSPA